MPTSNDIFKIVQDKVVNCTRCDLHLTCTAPVPISGKPYAQILVIGEAPGQTEDEEGKPFVGASGKLLKWCFREARVRIDNVSFTNTVRCRPPNNRTPFTIEREKCRVNLNLELAASKAKVVILAGGVALNTIRPDLQIKENHSRPLLYRDRIYVPTYHPASALRNPKIKEIIVEDIKQAAYWVRHFDDANTSHPLWPKTCRRCEGDVGVEYDSMGICYCIAHYRPYIPAEQGALF